MALYTDKKPEERPLLLVEAIYTSESVTEKADQPEPQLTNNRFVEAINDSQSIPPEIIHLSAVREMDILHIELPLLRAPEMVVGQEPELAVPSLLGAEENYVLLDSEVDTALDPLLVVYEETAPSPELTDVPADEQDEYGKNLPETSTSTTLDLVAHESITPLAEVALEPLQDQSTADPAVEMMSEAAQTLELQPDYSVRMLAVSQLIEVVIQPPSLGTEALAYPEAIYKGRELAQPLFDEQDTLKAGVESAATTMESIAERITVRLEEKPELSGEFSALYEAIQQTTETLLTSAPNNDTEENTGNTSDRDYLEIACRRLLQCLEEDFSDVHVQSMIAVLLQPPRLRDQPVVPGNTKNARDGTREHKLFSLDLDTVRRLASQVLPPWPQLLGRLALAPVPS